MEVVLIVFKCFEYFHGSHIFLESEIEFFVYPVSITFLKKVEK